MFARLGQWDFHLFKIVRAQPFLRRVAGRGRAKQLLKIRRAEQQVQVAQTDLLGVWLVSGILGADSKVFERVRHDTKRTLGNANFGNDQLAGQRFKQRAFVALNFFRAPHMKFSAERNLFNDVERFERAL